MIHRPIVGVHGIGNLSQAGAATAAAVLGERWTRALQKGLGGTTRVEVVTAYYSDLLAKDVAQSSPRADFLNSNEQALLLAWAAGLGAPAEIAQGRLTAPARAAVDFIARRFNLDSSLAQRFIAMFCREVPAYLDHPGNRAAVRERVIDTIRSTQPLAVLAHSLGSVITYEALWANPGIELELLVTLGSPLGMPGAILPKLDPLPAPPATARPPGVREWINIADPGDIVAVPRKGLATAFPGVTADLTTSIGIVDFHKVQGYLASPTTAGVLAAVL